MDNQFWYIDSGQSHSSHDPSSVTVVPSKLAQELIIFCKELWPTSNELKQLLMGKIGKCMVQSISRISRTGCQDGKSTMGSCYDKYCNKLKDLCTTSMRLSQWKCAKSPCTRRVMKNLLANILHASLKSIRHTVDYKLQQTSMGSSAKKTASSLDWDLTWVAA